jgi:DNA-binding transcriptional LysR family regulator
MDMANQLDLYQLRAFHALGQTGSFTGAARRLNLTQSAVSHAIAKLEATAGTELVERRAREFRLTEQGDRLFLACEEIFATLEAAAEDLDESRATGRLRLGATVEFGSSILMRHIQPFLAAHPGVEIDFTLAHDLLAPLLRDDLDLVIDCQEHFLPELDRRPLFRETFVVAGSPGFQAAYGLRTALDLAGCPVLSLDKAGAWWHRFLLPLPEPERPGLTRIIEVNHLRAMINAGIAGLGALLAPTYSVLRELERGDLMDLLPAIRPVEERFCIYQKKRKVALRKQRMLTEYLQTISPAEFGVFQ